MDQQRDEFSTCPTCGAEHEPAVADVHRRYHARGLADGPQPCNSCQRESRRALMEVDMAAMALANRGEQL